MSAGAWHATRPGEVEGGAPDRADAALAALRLQRAEVEALLAYGHTPEGSEERARARQTAAVPVTGHPDCSRGWSRARCAGCPGPPIPAL